MRVCLSWVGVTLLLAMAAAPSAHGQGAPAADGSFLKGYWLSCTSGQEISETWSDARGGVMVGTSLTLSRGKASWELLRIGPSAAGLSYFAQPSGQAPAEFPLAAAKSTATRLVFEDPAHDFPQRVIYERRGEKLAARIEGEIGGKARSMEWLYEPAVLNQRCPFPVSG